MPGWLCVPEAKQHRGEEREREGVKERENEELQKVCETQLQGTVVRFSFLLCILGLLKRHGISRVLFCAAPQIQREERFVASFEPYFAFKIFKASQKAL